MGTYNKLYKKSDFSISQLTEILNYETFGIRHEGYMSDSENFTRSYTNMLILQFDSSGNSQMKEMKRSEVLNVTRQAAEEVDVRIANLRDATTSPKDMPSVRYDSSRLRGKGNVRAVYSGVQMRDLRKLDAAFTISNEPSIMVRKQAILVNADPIRAVILRHTCLIFVPDGADGLLSSLMTCFREQSTEENYLPFEFRAMEAVLSTLNRSLISDFNRLVPLVNSALDQLTRDRMNSGELEALRTLKNSVNEFHLQVGGIRRALMEILDHDEDMSLLYLTKIYESPEMLDKLDQFDPEDAEMLLEAYLQDIHTTRTKVEMMQHRIQNTESLVMIKLDSTRNQLLTVDVLFGLLTMCMGLGTFVTGAFGMNLKSGWEERNDAFWKVLFGTVATSVVVVLGFFYYFKRRGLIMR